MTKFKEWVVKMERQARNNRERFLVGIMPHNIRVTICYDNRTGKIGVSRCHPDDKIDRKIGIAIAYARCRGYEIPKQVIYKTLDNMANGDIFFSFFGVKNIYIGKCNDYQDGCAYAVQNVRTGKIAVVTDGTREYEMVE